MFENLKTLLLEKSLDLRALLRTIHHPNIADSYKTFCSKCFSPFFYMVALFSLLFYISCLYELSVYGYGELSVRCCVLINSSGYLACES